MAPNLSSPSGTPSSWSQPLLQPTPRRTSELRPATPTPGPHGPGQPSLETCTHRWGSRVPSPLFLPPGSASQRTAEEGETEAAVASSGAAPGGGQTGRQEAQVGVDVGHQRSHGGERGTEQASAGPVSLGGGAAGIATTRGTTPFIHGPGSRPFSGGAGPGPGVRLVLMSL